LATALIATFAQAQAGPEKMTLIPKETCVTDPNGVTTIDVYLDQIDPAHPILGANVNLAWDPNSCWQVIDIVPGPGFLQIGEEVAPGSVRYAINRETGQPGITQAQVIATITFKATVPPSGCCVEEICLTAGSGASATKVFGAGGYQSVPQLGPCVEIRIDVVPPTITCGPDMTVDTLPDLCHWKPSSSQPIVKPTYSDNCDCPLVLTFVRSDGKTGLNAKYELGETFITWTVTDCCGNQASCVQRILVEDNQPPQIRPSCADREVCADRECKFVLRDIREVVEITDNCTVDPNVVQEPPAGTVFGLGEHDVVVGANDNSGNNTTCTIKFIVKDCSPPAFTIAPTDIETCADAGKCCAKVSWDVAAEDNCDGAITLQCSPPSGTCFPIGETEVTCTATDEAGNVATHTFKVIVNPCWNLNVKVCLKGRCNMNEFERCVEFELEDCDKVLPPASVYGEVAFVAGVGQATLSIPIGSQCVEGEYDCARARDIRYSLWSTVEGSGKIGVTPDKKAFYAVFCAEDSLVLGNLNGDTYIDVADWIIWMLEFTGQMPIPPIGEDVCNPFPDPTDPAQQVSDINGDGRTTAADYAHIYANMWAEDDAGCCPPLRMALMAADGVSAPGPLSRISIAQLNAMGLGAAASLDYNRDGFVGVADMVLAKLGKAK